MSLLFLVAVVAVAFSVGAGCFVVGYRTGHADGRSESWDRDRVDGLRGLSTSIARVGRHA